MAEKNKKALVIGIGNILLRDEGLGVRAVEFFKEHYILPGGVDCVDGGTAGLSLSTFFRDYRRVIIVDAVSSGGPPGSILKFGKDDLAKAPPLRTTAHQLGIKELLAIAEFEGYSPDIRIIGVVPSEISVGFELTPLIKGRLPEIARAMEEELATFGIRARKKKKDA
ncbi:MAG: HyaD/HybD family hydrogenase maturation endopeptidase [Deltaproteobacteria bacterium]|nr:HyaD/HybD family hydrogenase maturation endopeptidase [Deltaproteobacteria bacterium]